MKVTGPRILRLSTTVLIVVAVLVWVFTPSDVIAYYEATYVDSAHGNESYGVNRSGTPEDELRYHIGSCAHCHDTFDESICGVNELMLFAPLYTSQSDNHCSRCHQSPIASVQVDMPNQYSYSVTRGGAPEGCPRSIGASFRFIKENGGPREQCNSATGSAHRLTDIRVHLLGNWGFSDTLDEINPCSGCHNPHEAKKDLPCSLPSSHEDTSTWGAWGDGNGEKMADGGAGGFSGVYQSPYKMGWTPEVLVYEWVDNNEAPDYVWLCSDCHWPRGTPQPYSTRWGVLTTVNFYADGHQHGSGHEIPHEPTDLGNLRLPYDLTESTNYVLMCTDCHEPHGSPNYKLLRTCVNGVNGISVTDWNDNPGWTQFCNACHSGGAGAPGHPGGYCHDCHGHGGDHF